MTRPPMPILQRRAGNRRTSGGAESSLPDHRKMALRTGASRTGEECVTHYGRKLEVQGMDPIGDGSGGHSWMIDRKHCCGLQDCV